MVKIDLDLDGMSGLQDAIDDWADDIRDDAVYVVGSNVEYGVYLEFGTEKMPPYPWFKPALREFRANPEAFITDKTGYGSVDEIDSAQELVEAVAFALENTMTANVSAGTATDRSPGTDPEHPSRDTGTLVSSISAQRIK